MTPREEVEKIVESFGVFCRAPRTQKDLADAILKWHEEREKQLIETCKQVLFVLENIQYRDSGTFLRLKTAIKELTDGNQRYLDEVLDKLIKKIREG